MNKILFVCHGNICRSPMAEFIMKDLVKKAGLEDEFEISSAATTNDDLGADMYYLAKRKLDEKGIPYSPRKARRVTPNDYFNYDRIYIMDSDNAHEIKWIIPKDLRKKIQFLNDEDISDPWYSRNFERAYQQIKEGCEKRLEELSHEKS